MTANRPVLRLFVMRSLHGHTIILQCKVKPVRLQKLSNNTRYSFITNIPAVLIEVFSEPEYVDHYRRVTAIVCVRRRRR